MCKFSNEVFVKKYTFVTAEYTSLETKLRLCHKSYGNQEIGGETQI